MGDEAGDSQDPDHEGQGHEGGHGDFIRSHRNLEESEEDDGTHCQHY